MEWSESNVYWCPCWRQDDPVDLLFLLGEAKVHEALHQSHCNMDTFMEVAKGTAVQATSAPGRNAGPRQKACRPSTNSCSSTIVCLEMFAPLTFLMKSNTGFCMGMPVSSSYGWPTASAYGPFPPSAARQATPPPPPLPGVLHAGPMEEADKAEDASISTSGRAVLST